MLNNKISEIEIRYRSKVKLQDAPRITTSNEAHTLLRPYFSPDTIELYESSYLMLLNRGNKAKGVLLLSQGGTSNCIVDPRMIFMWMLKTNSYAAILAHNHPSGNLQPSKSDIDLTKRLTEGAKLLDMKFFDHLILSPDGAFYSFQDEGMM